MFADDTKLYKGISTIEGRYLPQDMILNGVSHWTGVKKTHLAAEEHFLKQTGSADRYLFSVVQ